MGTVTHLEEVSQVTYTLHLIIMNLCQNDQDTVKRTISKQTDSYVYMGHGKSSAKTLAIYVLNIINIMHNINKCIP